jgi:hypothetical protein
MTGIGVHGDDYTEIIGMQNIGLTDFLNPDPYNHTIQILGLPNFYTYWWAYPVLGYEYQWIYDFIKIFVHCLSIKLIFVFAKDYFNSDRALLFSLLFVLYPLHDATTYWYMTLYYVTIPAILLYAHSLIRNDRYFLGFGLTLIGSMWHYASPPYVLGMAMVFFFEKKFKKGILFLIPGFIYLLYYFWFKHSFPDVERRISPEIEILSFLKNFLLQIFSFLEASLGPSYWLKVFYSIQSLSFISVAFILLIFGYLFQNWNISLAKKINKPLFFGLIFVVFLSFSMFALTGLYTHSAFNLSNRTTIYGSLLLAFLITTYISNKRVSLIILTIVFIMPVFGLSDHWKSWNTHQKTIIENIQENQSLKDIDENSTIIVTGNLYSKLGPFSHIEFFSMPWNVNALFKNHTKSGKISPLAPYTSFKNELLVDEKFDINYSLKNKIYVYDSIENSVKEINKSNIDELIKKQPKVVRHWTQLAKNTWLQKSIVWLSPRLSYLFK